MPASVATLLTLVLIVALFAWDSRRSEKPSAALWLPVLWVVVTGSRFPSQWLNLGNQGPANYADGSPLDAAYFALLILSGVAVLMRRRVLAGELVRQNFWLVALLLYGVVSIMWSDFPLIALKRWVKTLGHPVMALIVLTDPNPGVAFRIVMRRCAFFLLPLSVLFIKYLPVYGRAFDYWTGQGYYRGIMLSKNDLGYVCMLFGLFFAWNILSCKSISNPRVRRDEVLLSLGFLVMIVWLLIMADSATSMATMVIGILAMIGLGTPFVSKRFLGTYVIVLAVTAIGAEQAFDVYEKVVGLLGRDPTLTDRTEVWIDAIALQTKPLVGMGFESFWLGSRLDLMAEKWWWRPNQAHNGYIEIYLNLGLIGLFLFFGLIVSTFRKAAARLPADFEFSRFRLAVLLSILTHNYTEATFKGVHLMWTMFHIIALDYLRTDVASEKAASAVSNRLIRRRKTRVPSRIRDHSLPTSDPTT